MDFNDRFSSLNCGNVSEKSRDCSEVLDFVQNWAEEKIKNKKAML